MEGPFVPPLPPGTNPRIYAWRALALASPAAGADFTYTIPSGRVYWVQSVIAQLVTAVAVANRHVTVQVNDGAQNVANYNAGVLQTASLTWTYTFAAGFSISNQQDGVVLAGLPQYLILPPQWILRASTNLLQGADQWSAIVVLFAEYVWDGSPPQE